MFKNFLTNKTIRTDAVQVILLPKKYFKKYLRRSLNIRIDYKRHFLQRSVPSVIEKHMSFQNARLSILFIFFFITY